MRISGPRRLYHRLSSHRRLVAYALYSAVTAVAYFTAFLLRFDLLWPAVYMPTFMATLPVLIGVRLGSYALFDLATGRWRYVGLSDVLRLLCATALGSVVFFLAVQAIAPVPSVPRAVLLAEWFLTTYLTAGLWVVYRVAFQMARHRDADAGAAAPRRRVLIIGAGAAGSRLAHEMVTFPTGYDPIAFVDDDPVKWGTRIHGVEVVGSVVDLRALAKDQNPDALILALPSTSPADMRRLVAQCEITGIQFQILPAITEVLNGRIGVSQLREVRIEDLLGRQPVELSLPELAEDFRGRTVLITGAAGSIGSELARQVARHGPGRLILLDHAESGLYFIELELRRKFPEVDLRPIVGDILDRDLIEALFSGEPIHRTFHAAAYKHVPLMELNVRQAVRNNVVGTWMLAQVAGRNGCERFVLISTDKAVQPSSAMGASKGIAELVVLAAQRHFPDTAFHAVRFGNVLGSQGSVIPVFQQQLADGDALTVTHPDVTRFFMTIPEATQLVLQASILEDAPGRIAMLDMGEPIRILDLARNLIRLSGEHRDPDSRIRYIGLRPGEKLHEELVSPDEDERPTPIGKVHMVTRDLGAGLREMEPWVRRWLVTLDHDQVSVSLAEVWLWCHNESVGAADMRVVQSAD
ncbi:MAG: polysaccharide biosynthesis protein [Gemmatimonadetes bacterium]|nr:polysaccharide biosynthesis protein [Gemmatimonadota bacterium]